MSIAIANVKDETIEEELAFPYKSRNMSCFQAMFIPVVDHDNCELHDLEIDISTPACEARIADWTPGADLSQKGSTANCMIAGAQAENAMHTKDMIHVPC